GAVVQQVGQGWGVDQRGVRRAHFAGAVCISHFHLFLSDYSVAFDLEAYRYPTSSVHFVLRVSPAGCMPVIRSISAAPSCNKNSLKACATGGSCLLRRCTKCQPSISGKPWTSRIIRLPARNSRAT